MVFNNAKFTSKDVFGTYNTDVACQYAGLFPNQAAFDSLANYTCVNYDAKSCALPGGETQMPVAPTPTSPVQSPATAPSSNSPAMPTPHASAFTAVAPLLSVVTSLIAVFVVL